MKQMIRARLAAARKQKYWTLGDAAEKIGVSPTTVHKWERGKATPHPRFIQKLCDVYGVPASALDLGDAENTPFAPLPDLAQEEGEAKTLQKASSLLLQSDLEMRLLCMIFQGFHSPQSSRAGLQVSIASEIGRYDDMNSKQQGFDPVRRNTLRRLACLPVQALGLSALGALAIPGQSGEILTHCAAGIVACSHLSRGQHEDLSLALSALTTYLPALIQVVKDDSSHRKEAARLTAQALLLKAT